MNITPKDAELIDLLKSDGRMSVSDIARNMSASRTAVQKRLEKLERNQVITGYTVTLSREYQQQTVRALVMIKFAPRLRQNVEEKMADIKQLTALYSISGVFDIAAIIEAQSMAELDKIIDQIGFIEAIDETLSSIIMSTKLDR